MGLQVKKISLALVLFMFFSITYGQTNTIQPHRKVIEAFGAKHVTYLQQNFPDSVLFYNFLLENSFKIIKKESLNKEKFNTLDTIKLNSSWINDDNVDFKKFNVLLAPVKPDTLKDMYYKIADTDNILLLKSMNYNKKKFEGYKSLQK